MVLEGVIPANLHAEMFEAVKREDLRAARRVADRMYPVVQATYAEPFLDGHNRMKEALAILSRTRLLGSGLGKSKLGRWLFASPRLRNWLYYGARRGTREDLRRLARTDQEVVVIGDAAQAGKARDALDGAFRAALFPEHEQRAGIHALSDRR